jgi:hypothetical protein
LFDAIVQSFTPSDPSAAVQGATSQAQEAISVCEQDDRRCLADALDAYAEALRKLAPSLPPPLRVLPDIVSKAAHRVRIAKTKVEAVRAIATAVAEVHKTISLLTATDTFTPAVAKRDGEMIAQTLELAATKIERASGL